MDQAGKIKQKAGQRLSQGGDRRGVGDADKDKWEEALLESFWQLAGEK